jgi:hypothetical protein
MLSVAHTMTANEDLVHSVSRVSSWRPSTSGMPSARAPKNLPSESLDLLSAIGPGEGFIANRFLRLYPPIELDAINVAYHVGRYMPDHLLIGSDGCGNALLLDRRANPYPVIEVAFIPLDAEYATKLAPDFGSFIVSLTRFPLADADAFPRPLNPHTAGLELHEKHPIVLGGDPTGPGNRVLLSISDHVQACEFFNRLFREVRDQSKG